MCACLVIVIILRDIYVGRIRVHTCTVAIIVSCIKKTFGVDLCRVDSRPDELVGWVCRHHRLIPNNYSRRSFVKYNAHIWGGG